MKIALIVPPLKDHWYRGTGIYMTNLIQALEKYTDLDIIKVDYDDISEHVDCYHFPYFDPFFLTLPWFRKVQTVVTIHDLIPIKFSEHFKVGIKGSIKWFIQKLNISTVSAIITDSESSRIDIINIIGIDPNLVHAINLAPDDEFISEIEANEVAYVRSRYRLPDRFFLFVGDVNWNKNLPSAITAAIKTNSHLVIVSKKFTEKNDRHNAWNDSLIKAQNQISDGNKKLIHSLGFLNVHELHILYCLAESLLFPSFYEGFGLPIVEAFASGCPVISSDKGSLKEIVQDAALIINPYDIVEITRALKLIQNNKLLKENLIKRGKKRLKHFSWKLTALKTAEVYKSVVNI